MGIGFTCKDVAERANALIDGELGFADRLKIRLHLAICKGCDHFIHQMRQTKALIRASAAMPAEEVPPAALDAILARVARPEEEPEPKPDG
ncbi:anti-sigma factor family protein [Solirhodobacter olei]|uniref:anti-sigma factor family protein n=1 Tax=Solirhodobacter olei TaxID=2493082 RepID=UPI000FDA5703|nr:zf-HC2 domain-containing protein [Solirhodobacter olei]